MNHLETNNEHQAQFHGCLKTKVGAAAFNYVFRRGITATMCVRWGLGFCDRRLPDEYEVLKNRLTFPIYDWQGRLVSFSGRIVGNGKGAKYIGMTDTPVFEKFKNVYGLEKALPHIVSSGVAIVVEGYLDVIACHELARLPMTVGTMGIALTEWQVLLLARWARLVILVMDGDRAGKAAVVKAVKDYQEAPIRLGAVTLPQGKDPFDMAIAQGPEFGNWVKHNVREYK